MGQHVIGVQYKFRDTCAIHPGLVDSQPSLLWRGLHTIPDASQPDICCPEYDRFRKSRRAPGGWPLNIPWIVGDACQSRERVYATPAWLLAATVALGRGKNVWHIYCPKFGRLLCLALLL